MKFEDILFEPDRHVLTITLNRPEVLNAMRPQTCGELADALLAFQEDAALRVAILRGSGGRAFSVGADLKHLAAQAGKSSGRSPIQYPSDGMLRAFERCRKPIIAAVRGYAIGGGFELVLRCDLVVAADSACFGLPEVKRGLIADTGGLYFLPKRIPYHAAMGIILTGEMIDARQAARWGLVNEVVPDEQLEAAAQRWAERILQCAPLAVEAAKEAVRTFSSGPTEPALAEMDRLAAVQRMRQSEDYQEGPRAFAEKRQPVWKGR